MCACSSAHLCVRQREYRHLCSHLNGVFLLLQTHLSLLLLLLQTLDCQLSLYLQILLQLPITVSFPSSRFTGSKEKQLACFFCLMIPSFWASWICLCLSASSAACLSFSLCSSLREFSAARASRTCASLS